MMKHHWTKLTLTTIFGVLSVTLEFPACAQSETDAQIQAEAPVPCKADEESAWTNMWVINYTRSANNDKE